MGSNSCEHMEICLYPFCFVLWYYESPFKQIYFSQNKHLEVFNMRRQKFKPGCIKMIHWIEFVFTIVNLHTYPRMALSTVHWQVHSAAVWEEIQEPLQTCPPTTLRHELMLPTTKQFHLCKCCIQCKVYFRYRKERTHTVLNKLNIFKIFGKGIKLQGMKSFCSWTCYSLLM